MSDVAAVFMRQTGAPDVLELRETSMPTAGVGQILIEVAAAGVNRPDISQRVGTYPVPKDASPILGLEVSGTVLKVGNGVNNFAPGDRVFALTHGGGYATHCTVDARHAFRMPEGLGFVEAAALPEVAYTVEFNLFIRSDLSAGETVLIHGGSSGIGSHATDRAVRNGATVITTCGSEQKCEFSRSRGAALSINYRTTDWVKEVMAFTRDRGVDVVLDMVGGDYVNRNLRCLADDGRYSLISLQAGKQANVELEGILRRRLTLAGSTLRPLNPDRKAEIAESIRRRVLPLIEQGALLPHIHQTFPLAEAAAAHRLMESGEHLGKIVLTVRNSNI